MDQLKALKVNKDCPRLKQYKVLEEKREAKNEFSSDEEFLAASDIRITISTNCEKQFDRLLDLINRSNQLNFTKKRIDETQFRTFLNDPCFSCGYVSCKDKYGNYGIIGFYALDTEENRLEHFLFSCRTLGMGIEQFVYAYLGFPQLDVVGNVVVTLNESDKPNWIHLAVDDYEESVEKGTDNKVRVLAKGPCDVAQIIPFFSSGAEFEEEFSYVSRTRKNLRVDAHNHTTQILQSLLLDDDTKSNLIKNINFLDEEFFNTKTFTQKYDYLLISGLVDASLGLYKCKENPNLILAYDQYTIDITKESNWERYTGSIEPISESFLHAFKDAWEFIGIIDDESLMKNLEEIRSRIPDSTKIIILGGAEIPFPGKVDVELKDRHLVNKHFNEIYRKFVEEHKKNCHFIDVNAYLGNSSNYADTINHYKKIIYFKIAEELKAYIAEKSKGASLEKQNEEYLQAKTKKQNENMIKRRIKRLFKPVSYLLYKIFF